MDADSLKSEVQSPRAGLKTPERGWVVRDQPQRTSHFRRVEEFAARCGWSATQPRSVFKQALTSGVPGGRLKTSDFRLKTSERLCHV
jgi:hypothetical protein